MEGTAEGPLAKGGYPTSSRPPRRTGADGCWGCSQAPRALRVGSMAELGHAGRGRGAPGRETVSEGAQQSARPEVRLNGPASLQPVRRSPGCEGFTPESDTQLSWHLQGEGVSRPDAGQEPPRRASGRQRPTRPLTSFLSPWSPMLAQTSASSCSLRWPLPPTPSSAQTARTQLSGVSDEGLPKASERQAGGWPATRRTTGEAPAPVEACREMPALGRWQSGDQGAARELQGSRGAIRLGHDPDLILSTKSHSKTSGGISVPARKGFSEGNLLKSGRWEAHRREPHYLHLQ